MTELLILFFIANILGIWGFYAASDVEFYDDDRPELGVREDSKMILWRLKVWTVKNLGYFWGKPVCLCPTCMSSLHSTYWYLLLLFLTGFPTPLLIFYPYYVFALAGTNYILGIAVSKMKS